MWRGVNSSCGVRVTFQEVGHVRTQETAWGWVGAGQGRGAVWAGVRANGWSAPGGDGTECDTGLVA